jgi:tRNA (guanine37-N1)-methyltransferase
MHIDVITLFPDMFPGPLAYSIPGRALERGLAQLQAHDLREWGLGRHRSVDDYPYGGGAGMIMRPEPIAAALEAVAPERGAGFRILLDPGGEPFRQVRAHDLAERDRLVFVCPRYEGVDDRVRSLVDLELSIGDYVLSGGEIAALTVIDAVLRLLPGAIEDDSTEDESFAAGLLEYPQWTRPPEFAGMRVPEILTRGDHGAVDAWRHEQAFERTRRVRPDLLSSEELEDG